MTSRSGQAGGSAELGWRSKKRVLSGLLLAAGGVLLAGGLYGVKGHIGAADQTLVHYVVKRADLPITVTERGNVESQSEVKINCDVADVEGDDVKGTRVQFVVPNGSSVTEGQLLLELDSAGHIERLDRQILATEKARSTQITARVKYDNQHTQNETSRADADLQVQLAKLTLDEFIDKEGGSFQINLQDVEMLIQEALASRLIEKKNLKGVERLYKLGYRSTGELASTRLSALKSERALASAISKKKQLVGYQYRKTELELTGKVASVERALEQIERDNEAFLAQAKAAMDAADASMEKEEERLERYKKYVQNCKIYAPQDGMVAFHVCRWHQPIREGSAVQFQQFILSIPNLKRMQVNTRIHESVLDLIHRGLPVTVRIDAFPDRTYNATVESVAVLPDVAEKTKVYPTIITITEDVKQLKPGMTALCEIHVELLRNVLSIPVQAIVQIGRDSWCYVDNGDGIERRILKLGSTNEKFIEVRDGLQEGDRVVLNPDVLTERDSSSQETIAPDSDIPENMDTAQIDAARIAQGEGERKP